MSIEEIVHRHCCIGDIVTYLDAATGSECWGKIAGWGIHHSGLRYVIVVSGQSEKQVALYRVLSCQKRSGDVLQFRRASDILVA